MKINLFVDSVNEDICRLISEDEREILFPFDLLPEGTREGDWLTLSFEKAPEVKQKYYDETAALLNDLINN